MACGHRELRDQVKAFGDAVARLSNYDDPLAREEVLVRETDRLTDAIESAIERTVGARARYERWRDGQ